MQVEQRHEDAAIEAAKSAGCFRNANLTALAKAFARFEASLPPSAPDQEAIARKAKQLGDAEGDPNWWRFKDAALAALTTSVLAESTSNDSLQGNSQ